jgi:hypothetical protein
MQSLIAALLVASVALSTGAAALAAPSIGAAPKGDAAAVASRVIKYNFPKCRKVGSAARTPDGSILANCDGVDYLVFTLRDPSDGKTHEVALNCKAAKEHLNISCYKR